MKIKLEYFPTEYLELFKTQVIQFKGEVIEEIFYNEKYHHIIVDLTDYCELFLIGAACGSLTSINALEESLPQLEKAVIDYINPSKN